MVNLWLYDNRAHCLAVCSGSPHSDDFSMTFPLEFTPLEPQLEEQVQRVFPGRHLLCCRGSVVTPGYRDIAEDILGMEVRHDDVWVCSYPKSGTTWTEEMVWCIANDLDFIGAKVSLMDRFPFLEFSHHFHTKKHALDKETLKTLPRILTHSVDVVKEMKSPRFIKTHLPFNLLPLQLQSGTVKPKMIHVFRDPMDVCVSYFHHNQLMVGCEGDLEQFADLFISNAVLYTPFWKHTLGYLEKKNDFNILFLKYEDLAKDLQSVVARTADFLNKNITADQTTQLCNHLSFENMRNNPAANNEDMVRLMRRLNGVRSEGRFLREGRVGQWESRFSQEWKCRFREWTRASVRGTELENEL